MATLPPLPATPGKPRRYLLNEGTRLTRVHSAAFSAASFNPVLADVLTGGGRFDATREDSYGFLYAGSADACAISETLLRDFELDPAGGRLIPRVVIKEKLISWIRPAVDLTLVSIQDAEDFGALQLGPTWLTQSPSEDYHHTRRWGHAIRKWAPWAQGFVWISRFCPPARSFVFFEDRLAGMTPAPFKELLSAVPFPPGSNRLDIGAAHHHLLAILGDLRFSLSP